MHEPGLLSQSMTASRNSSYALEVTGKNAEQIVAVKAAIRLAIQNRSQRALASAQTETCILRDAGCSVEITIQFGLDADAIVRRIEQLRREAIDVPFRIGVPGPPTPACF